MLKRALPVALTLCVASCSLTGQADEYQPYYVTTPVVTGYELSPSEIHVGDTVLVSFSIGSRVVEMSGFIGHDTFQMPSIRTTIGEVVPLVPEFYTAGSSLPSFDEAKSFVEANYPHNTAEQVAFQNGHYYALFRAPASPQPGNINFSVYSQDGHGAEGKSISVPITVLP